MEEIYGFNYNSVDSKNRVVIPRFMREKITSEIGSVIIYESIMRYYDVEKLYKAIEELKKGSYASANEEVMRNHLKELCTLFSNLRLNVKIDANGRTILPEVFASKAGQFKNVDGNKMIKLIGEGSSIAMVPNQIILDNYETGLYGESIVR